jgi:hypothetical protein
MDVLRYAKDAAPLLPQTPVKTRREFYPLRGMGANCHR